MVQEFKNRGYFVRALARTPAKLDHLQDSLDEVVKAEVTRPETLKGVCNDMDVVFSSIGITRQKDGLTFRDVDYQGNKNLLNVALEANVGKFIYVSVFNGRNLRHLDIVDAHECFVDDLKTSCIDHSIIRPTGYFSDMEEFLDMAKKGRVYLIGSGQNRMNPIHGADLAVICVNAMEQDNLEIDIGGPEVKTYREIAELALEVAGKSIKVTCVPLWLMKIVIAGARIFNRHQSELLSFFTTASISDNVAPAFGTYALRAHFLECALQQSQRRALH